MQIIVCKRGHLLRSSGNDAAQPKLTTGAANPGHLVQKAVRVMKLTAFFILATCLHVNATDGFGQKVTLSEREVHIEKIFNEIKKQTGFNFLYTSNILANTKRVTVNVTNALVTEVLDRVVSGQGLEYRVKGEDKLIIIKTKPSVTEAKPVVLGGDKPIDEVRGVITDENGAPASGVNVVVRGTSKGTTTNLRGEFVLRDVKDGAVLLISSVGYDRQELVVRNNEIVRTQLRVAVGNLDELQVIAYGTTSKRFNTGNVTTVKASEIERQPINNPILALQGRVPGLVITQNTGVAGGGITVRVQGQNSLTKGNDPLYVVDGVPYMSQVPSIGLGSNILGNSGRYSTGVYSVSGVGNPMSFINPADIESIDVLKDADATAIYGSRAANGAILITTKKGKVGPVKVNVNVQQGVGKVGRKMDMLDTRQYLDMRYEALENDGISISSIPNTNSSYYDLKVWDTTSYTDWQDVLIGGTAQYSDINGSISGGSDRVQYLVGATYHRETTVFPGSFSDEKGSLYFNVNSFSSTRKFNFQFTGSYLSDKNQLPQIDLTGDALLTEPVAPALYNEDGTLNWQPLPSAVSTFDNNPMAALLNFYRNKTSNLIANTELSYRILPNLIIQSTFGYNKMQANEFDALPMAAIKPEDRPDWIRIAHYGNKDISIWNIEPQIKYSGKIVGKGRLDILLGGALQQTRQNGYNIEGQGYANDNILENIAAAPTIINPYQIFSKYKYQAFFGRITYNLLDRYIINLNARRDGSSRFGENNSFHNFGSAAAAWIISEEKFFQNKLPFISFAKISSSYGVTGNDQIGDYAFMNLYGNVNAGIAYQGTAGLEPRALTNPYLQWEKTKKISTGIDLGLWKDRIMLNITYARNRSSNQLISYILPSITGFPNVNKNSPATVQNTSLEISLNTTNVRVENFLWSSNLNFTIPKNKLISFPDIEESSYASTYFIGEPISVSYVYKFLEVDPTTGLYTVADINGNPTSSPSFEDNSTLINTMPKFYGGIQNAISFKGFRLDFLFQFVKQLGINYHFHSGNRWPGQFYRGKSNQPASVLDRWQKIGDETSVQKFSTLLDGFAATGSDANFTDASFVRLKNVSLSYQFSQKWLHKFRLNDFQVYLHGQNIATITNYKGLDPENQTLRSLPPLRVVTVGIKLGF